MANATDCIPNLLSLGLDLVCGFPPPSLPPSLPLPCPFSLPMWCSTVREKLPTSRMHRMVAESALKLAGSAGPLPARRGKSRMPALTRWQRQHGREAGSLTPLYGVLCPRARAEAWHGQMDSRRRHPLPTTPNKQGAQICALSDNIFLFKPVKAV